MNTKAVLLLLVLGASPVYAGEAVDKTLQVSAAGWVRIENVRGHIQVEGWDRDEVSVKGTLDDEAERLDFDTDGATTNVKVVTPNLLKSGEGSDLTIRVPLASRVRVKVVSANVQLTNVHGGVDAKTVSGDIEANDLATRIEITTVSGNIAVTGSRGTTQFHSVSGDIQASVAAESLDIGTISGDATVQSDVAMSAITLNSVSGDMDVNTPLGDGVRVKGSSVSGDIRLTLNRDASVVIDLDTTAGGSIKNAISADVPKHGYGPGRELQFTLGAGKGAIDLTSVSGTLELAPR